MSKKKSNPGNRKVYWGPNYDGGQFAYRPGQSVDNPSVGLMARILSPLLNTRRKKR